MKKLSLIRDFLNNNLILLLSILVLLVGYNDILNIMIVVIIAIVIASVEREKLLSSYIYLYLFDEIFKIKNIYGLTIIFVYPIIALRLLYYIIRNKLLPDKKDIYITLFFLVSLAMSILTFGLVKASFVVVMEAVIVIMFAIILKKEYTTAEKKKAIIEEIFITIIYGALNSILYGLLHNNFMIEKRAGKLIRRFKGAYEPNYTAMFMNIGIVSILCLWKKYKKSTAVIILSALILGLLLTKSTTGLFCLIIILFIFVIKNWKLIVEKIKNANIKKYGKFFLIGIILAIIILVCTELKYKFLTDKLAIVFEKVKTGNLNSATSGRIPIIKSFYKSFSKKPIYNQLFGNAPQSLKVYNNYFFKSNYAHNLYIDLFYSFGMVGGSIAIIYIFMKTFKKMFLGKKTENSDLLFYSRLILLITGIGLSVHAEVIFLLLFIL